MARDIVSNSRYRGLADAVIGQTPIEVCCSPPIAIPLGCQGVRSCLTPPVMFQPVLNNHPSSGLYGKNYFVKQFLRHIKAFF